MGRFCRYAFTHKVSSDKVLKDYKKDKKWSVNL